MNNQLASFAFKIEWYRKDFGRHHLDLFYFALKTAIAKFKHVAEKQPDRDWNYFGRNVLILGAVIQMTGKPHCPIGTCDLHFSTTASPTFISSKNKNKIIEGAISFVCAVLHEARCTARNLDSDYSIETTIMVWSVDGHCYPSSTLTFNSLSNNTHE